MNNFKMSKRKMKIVILMILLLLGTVVFLSLQIREITVTGNKHYTSEQIESLLFKDTWDRNAMICFFNNRFKDHEQIPFVEDYKIEFLSPVSVEVIIYEKSIVGYITYMGSYMYFDKDGMIVESSSGKLDQVPLITGLNFGHIALHQPLPVENDKIFDQIMTLTQLLSNYEIPVDRIQYDSKGHATLVIGDIRVVLGSNDDMNGKISELKDQLTVVSGLKGTIYLDTYDEAKAPTSYRFVKDK